MQSKKDSMQWIPLWIDKWIFGSTRIELQPDERSVWLDLMALSAKDHGFVRANAGVPYPIPQLAGLLCITEELLNRTIKRCIEVKKIMPCQDGSIFLPSWGEYQLSDRHKRRFAENLGRMTANPDTTTGKTDMVSKEPATNRIGEDRRGEDIYTAKSQKPISPDVKRFIDLYHDAFMAKFGEKPLIQGAKDGSNVKRLLGFIPFDQLTILLQRFFESDDSFIMSSGYTLGVFYSQINKLKIGKRTVRGKTFEAGDLWLRIKEEQDERKRSAPLQIPHDEGKGNPSQSDEPKP